MNNDVIKRREQLLNRMDSHSVALFFTGKAPHRTLDQFYPYTAQRNFYYLTNLDEPDMILLLIKGEEASKTMLFIEENTELRIKWDGARIEKDEAASKSGIEEKNIHYLERFKPVFNMMMNYARSPMGQPPQTLYLDLYHVNSELKPVALDLSASILENYPELTIKNVNEHLAYLRMFKSDKEVDLIRRAVQMTNRGLETIMGNLAMRKQEYQLQADFLHTITFEGSEGNAFDTIAACGKNATVLHYTQNRDALNHDDLILFDLGALHRHYAADISRTYPVSGTFTKRQRELYNVVLDVNKATIEQVKPGMTWKALNEFAKDLLAKKAVQAGVIKEAADIGQVYYHSIGHFLGLDVHDVGLYDEPFKPGMVLTIEPGLYVEEEKIGIRIEDDILVTENGYENLSKDIVKEADAIEATIKKLKNRT